MNTAIPKPAALASLLGQAAARSDLFSNVRLLAGMIFVTLAVLPEITSVVAQVPPKQVLQQSDFTYLGAFDLFRDTPAGMDATYTSGMALRYLGGELRMFSAAWNRSGPQSLFEVRVPSISLTSTPVASLVREWGNITGNLTTGPIHGLLWDALTNRLYAAFQNEYNACCADTDPSIITVSLNEANGTTATAGAWLLSGHHSKQTGNCVLAIPQWFADAHLGGKRLAAGCGGYESVVTSGPASIGPSLTAFNPPTNQAGGSTLASTNLVGYPFNGTPYTNPDRAHRDTDYTNDFDNWNPRNGVGYWSWSDQMKQSGVWLDTQTRYGVLFAPTLGNGRTWYETSTLHAERASHAWFMYDPEDLVKVAQGQSQEWQIQAKSSWLVQYSGLTYPLGGWQDVPPLLVIGMTFDATTNRLYVAVRFAGANNTTRIYVYRVSSDVPSGAVPPAAPTNLRVSSG